MLLTIDCGNTNTVFSIWDGTAFIATWRTATEHQRTADQYFVWLSSLMNLQGVKADIKDVIISSTVPRVVFNLRVLADRYFNTRPLVVGKPDCHLPIDVRVDAGTSVGPDRLVNTVAGHDLFGGNLVIVDFGTATTFDVVDADGAYIGGVIAPGVNLSLLPHAANLMFWSRAKPLGHPCGHRDRGRVTSSNQHVWIISPEAGITGSKTKARTIQQ